MGRGLVLGALFTSLVSLVFTSISSFAPLWLVLRTEVADQLCWWGEGIFASRVWFGDDLNTLVPPEPCQDPLGIGSISTYAAYCGDSPATDVLNEKDPVDYVRDMCQATRAAKATSLATIVLLLAGIALALMQLNETPLLQQTLQARRKAMGAGAVLCALQVCASLATWIIMSFSPLFSLEHKDALSAEHDGIPFERFASCSFTSPFRSVPLSLFTPASMQCLFPGPSYFLALGTCMCQLLALVFFHQRRIELLGADTGVSSSSVLVDLRKERVYSMYGSMARRTKHHRCQFFWITVLPIALAVLHALLWAGFLVWGMQIYGKVEVSHLKPGDSDELRLEELDAESAFVQNALASFSSKRALLQYTINAFNFSPVLAISAFINSGAGLLGLLCFVAMFVLPVSKSLAWLYLFFAPCDEHRKGWHLTLIDFSGKWQLAYLFTMTLQAVGLGLHVRYALPLGAQARLVLQADVGLGWGGLGSSLFIWACVTSLLLGQAVLLLHQKTVRWEEKVRNERRNAKPRALSSPGQMLTTPFLLGLALQQQQQQQDEGRMGTIAHGLDAIQDQDHQVESMCDRTFEPERNVLLKWTPLGKSVWWFLLFFIGGTFTFAQLVELVQIEMTDMNVFALPNPADRLKRISVFGTISMVLNTSVDNNRPYGVAVLLFVTLTLMPMVRLLAVAYLWVLPLTIRQQRRLFDFLEFSMAWASLEVYLVTLLAMALQMPKLMGSMSGIMTPSATRVILWLFPWMDGLMGADMELQPGFWFVAIVVLLEKVVARVIMAQAIASISERQLASALASKRTPASGRGEEEGLETPNTMREQEAEAAALFFSPAMRYETGVLLQKSYFYAGLPRHWWTNGMIKWGLLGEASLVEQYGTPPVVRSLQAVSSFDEIVEEGEEEQGEHGEPPQAI